MEELEYVKEVPETGGSERGLTAEITKSIANQQGVGGGLFTPDQSFINLTKKGLLTFYPYWFVVECF